MKRYTFLALILVMACSLLLAACGQGASAETAGKLVSAYFNSSSDDVTLLKVAPGQKGYYAEALYSGAGSHLVLCKIEKGGNGEDIIAQISEGSVAGAAGYSVNVVTDGGKVILFGYLNEAGTDFKKISITFDNNTKAAAQFGTDKGFIVVADGKLTLKDFKLNGADKNKTSSLNDYLSAGGTITTTSFVDVKGK